MAIPCCLDTYHISILQMLLWGTYKASNGSRNFRSLYGISSVTGLSMATIYRKTLELMNMGLIEKINKGNYIITTKGLLLLLLLYLSGDSRIDSDSFKLALAKLKEDWDLEEFSDEEVVNYIRVLERTFTKLKVPITRLCLKSLNNTISLIFASINNWHSENIIKAMSEFLDLSSDVIEGASRIIAKAILNSFPTITLNDGCKVAMIIYGEQARGAVARVLAMKCRLKGYSLGGDCPVVNSLIPKLLSKVSLKN